MSCAALLASLQALSAAQAYEADIHFSATYVLARAVGWPEADALTIASANQGVDENPDTVAALEMDATPSESHEGYVTSALRQAGKNLEFHCFSRSQGEPERIPADVLEVISRHLAKVPGQTTDARGHAGRLIALGVALHCQQDAFSHAGYGGSCGAHAGSCYGHTHHTLMDELAFRVLGRHYFNPDHPGVSGERLTEALQGTVRELATHRPKGSRRSIRASEVVALSDALRASGLELPDEVRRECNRYVAGKWLGDFFVSRSSKNAGSNEFERLSPEVAKTCKDASLGSATIVRIPHARYPRLDPDASPTLVRADGTYQVIRGGELDHALPGIPAAGIDGIVAEHAAFRVQLSHWRHALALPLVGANATRQRPGASQGQRLNKPSKKELPCPALWPLPSFCSPPRLPTPRTSPWTVPFQSRPAAHSWWRPMGRP